MTVTELSQQCPVVTHDYEVGEQVYKAFRLCSGDENPLHVDKDYALSKGFAGPVMYGNLLNAFVSHFVGVLLPCDEIVLHSQDISYHAPVYLNDSLHFEARCDSVSEAVQAIVYRFKFTRQDGDKRRLIARGHVQIGMLA